MTVKLRQGRPSSHISSHMNSEMHYNSHAIHVDRDDTAIEAGHRHLHMPEGHRSPRLTASAVSRSSFRNTINNLEDKNVMKMERL